MAQLASASGLGPEGPVFESQYPDRKEVDQFGLASFLLKKRGISSVGRALAWHARGHRFEPGILHNDIGKRNRKVIR